MREHLLKVADVMEELNLSRPTVYRYIRNGELRSVMIGGARRIPESAVDEFIEQRTTRATTGGAA